MKAKESGKGKKDAKAGEKVPCKFFLTEEGCKKGKQCKWQHALDGQRRCWRCGSTQHLAPECPRPSSSPEKPKAQKAAIQGEKETKTKTGEGSVQPRSLLIKVKQVQVMKSLIEEAGRMLKGMTVEEPRKIKEEARGAEKLAQLQRQLDALTKASAKVMRLTKVGWHGQRGLQWTQERHMRAEEEDQERRLRCIELQRCSWLVANQR